MPTLKDFERETGIKARRWNDAFSQVRERMNPEPIPEEPEPEQVAIREISVDFTEYIRDIHRGSSNGVDVELVARTAPSGITYRFITVAAPDQGNTWAVNLNGLDLTLDWNGSASLDRQEYKEELDAEQVVELLAYRPIQS